MKGTRSQCQSFNYSLSYLAAASQDLWALFSSFRSLLREDRNLEMLLALKYLLILKCCRWCCTRCQAFCTYLYQQGRIPTFSPSFTELKITQTIKELSLGKDNLQVFRFDLLFLQVAVPIPISQGHTYRYKVGVCFKRLHSEDCLILRSAENRQQCPRIPQNIISLSSVFWSRKVFKKKKKRNRMCLRTSCVITVVIKGTFRRVIHIFHPRFVTG